MVDRTTTTALRRALMSVYRFGPLDGARLLLGAAGSAGVAALRLPGFPAPVLLRRGGSDWPTFEKVFLDQEYRIDMADLAPRLIIDAGANVGYAALFFARRFPSARVLAVEPEAANFAQLVRNTAAYPRVTPIHAALWSRAEPLAIANPQAESWSFQVAAGAQGGVRGVTVPELLGLAGAERVDILKLDIEGAEKELFADGAERWLGRVGMLIIELHDRNRPGCSSSFYRALAGYEFGQFPLGENIVVVMQP
jgi:FkbM family methyltransferase